MQQKYVFLHTEKNLEETEDILKRQGLEIIFKHDHIYLQIHELNEEEKISLIKTMEERFKKILLTLNENEINAELFFEQSKSLKQTTMEILNLIKSNESDQLLTGNYAHIYHSMGVYNKKIESFASVGRRGFYFDKVYLTEGIPCSLLIARNGENFLRYLSFNEDPVITFTGPNANDTKLSLEKSF